MTIQIMSAHAQPPDGNRLLLSNRNWTHDSASAIPRRMGAKSSLARDPFITISMAPRITTAMMPGSQPPEHPWVHDGV